MYCVTKNKHSVYPLEHLFYITPPMAASDPYCLALDPWLFFKISGSRKTSLCIFPTPFTLIYQDFRKELVWHSHTYYQKPLRLIARNPILLPIKENVLLDKKGNIHILVKENVLVDKKVNIHLLVKSSTLELAV